MGDAPLRIYHQPGFVRDFLPELPRERAHIPATVYIRLDAVLPRVQAACEALEAAQRLLTDDYLSNAEKRALVELEQLRKEFRGG